jgi:transposase-like protein
LKRRCPAGSNAPNDNPEQIIKKLREADAMLAAEKSIGQLCQALEVSEQTYHRWRNGHRRAAVVAVG